MTPEERYGSLFVRRLRQLSGLTPFNYRDLQEIRGLDQEQLARRMQKKSYVLFRIIRDNSAEAAADALREQQQKQRNRDLTALTWMDGGACLADLLSAITNV